MTDTSGSRPAARAARKLSVLLALPALLAACGSTDKEEAESPPVLAFAVAPIRLVAGTDTLTLVAELAENDQQRALGLMERRHLADSAGMLFLYPADTSADAGYWMFRTRIPLDIAYVDSTGVIRSIQHMVPCPTDLAAGCPTYPPGVRYRAALEVNAGYLARHKLGLGARVILADTSRKADAHGEDRVPPQSEAARWRRTLALRSERLQTLETGSAGMAEYVSSTPRS